MKESREEKIRRLCGRVGVMPQPFVSSLNTACREEADDWTTEVYIRRICNAAGLTTKPVEPSAGRAAVLACCEETDKPPSPEAVRKFIHQVTE